MTASSTLGGFSSGKSDLRQKVEMKSLLKYLHVPEGSLCNGVKETSQKIAQREPFIKYKKLKKFSPYIAI